MKKMMSVYALSLVLSFALAACSNDKPAAGTVVDTNPVIVDPSATPIDSPTVTPSPTDTPDPTPTPVPTSTPVGSPTPQPTPDFTNCWSDDGAIRISFFRIVTPQGLRTYVTTGEGTQAYHVFTKPFCHPTPQIYGAMVSYVNPKYLHVKFPNPQEGGPLRGTAQICMGALCPGEIAITCEARTRHLLGPGCGSNLSLAPINIQNF